MYGRMGVTEVGARVQRLVSLGKPAMQGKPPKPLLSLEAAAKAMGIGMPSLKELIADGTVYSIPVGLTGKYRRVPVAEVDKWRTGGYDNRASGGTGGQ